MKYLDYQPCSTASEAINWIVQANTCYVGYQALRAVVLVRKNGISIIKPKENAVEKFIGGSHSKLSTSHVPIRDIKRIMYFVSKFNEEIFFNWNGREKSISIYIIQSKVKRTLIKFFIEKHVLENHQEEVIELIKPHLNEEQLKALYFFVPKRSNILSRV